MNINKLLGFALLVLLIIIASINTQNVSLTIHNNLEFVLPLALIIGLSFLVGFLVSLLFRTRASTSKIKSETRQTHNSFNGMKLYVGNLPCMTTVDDLVDTFGSYGAVRTARIITDKESGQPRGFGFVEMEYRDDAHLAISELNGADLHGQAIRVNKAHSRQSGRHKGRH